MISNYINVIIIHFVKFCIVLIKIFINLHSLFINFNSYAYLKSIKWIALLSSVINFIISLVIFVFFDFSYNQFQFVQEPYDIMGYSIYLGIDGISIYFILLTTIIMPIALLSN